MHTHCPYTLTHSDTPTHTHKHSLYNLLTHTHNMHIHLYWLYTNAHPLTDNHLIRCCYFVYHISWCLVTLHIYLYHSSIPAHCKYGTRTDWPCIESVLTYYLYSSYFLCFCSTLLFFVLHTEPCVSIRPPWTLRPFATFQASNIKI